jgi:hypothetical protein
MDGLGWIDETFCLKSESAFSLSGSEAMNAKGGRVVARMYVGGRLGRCLVALLRIDGMDDELEGREVVRSLYGISEHRRVRAALKYPQRFAAVVPPWYRSYDATGTVGTVSYVAEPAFPQ